ncbi:MULTISPECIES: sugar ABC transporter ATP-binding protein [unclassified Oceanispirochaeta]|uniref:sugar ABC transporter ATP-binding protein n=1 Tax=unclassified Oceanispirochaeta TaxID=2635722 RepID=UPI000E093F8F|nr:MULTISPECIES: sugar ABC transporter ATP-binding protein [unclassified Oceanispirochaeta]MBF9016968.1 sugar ABC transporter ATP-binding protein [Oceanispirochaeta sp. M2]NPD73331.1 sugar ABC transporter ATP-binding protein [Oceanispirochaeta sp. M1]RDG30992.1 sugar ABC transporter ATP-binding protein [Oceanispirochaeta sp. M1]
MSTENVLEMRGVSKSFPGVKALKNVDLSIRKGTVHALMGENGAGKSTLMKILYGVYQPDEGEVIFKGSPYVVKSPIDALNGGISMIPQEISPVPNLTVASNVFLGKEITTGRGFNLVNQKQMVKETQALFDELEIDIDPTVMMSEISIANAQLVAIATAVSYNTDLVIMDEPTSALTEKEIDKLYKIIKDLKEKKKIAIIYISHKLDEIFSICDEVSVLRDGEYIGSDLIENFNKDSLISMMVGRSMDEFFHKEIVEIGEVVLEVKNLTLSKKFENISFKLRQGEVLGVAGLMGAGRTEVMEAIFGFVPAESGEIYMDGVKVDIKEPIDAINHGIAFVTEDRKQTGIFPELSIKDNIIMPDVSTYLKHGLLDAKKIKKNCQDQREAISIKTPTLEQLIKNLSGGNQQKVLISRWLLTTPEVLILDEPTRGIDVGAKSEIHRLIGELAKMGKSIIMVSSEMPEILSMSDRIMVMHEGKYSGEINRDEATQEKILQLATGEQL